MKIKNYQYYTLLVLLVFFNAFILTANIALAAEIKFIPNVPIPGWNPGTINSNSFGQYINALYSYGAGFAGIAGMFMLVFAGYQWLFAAGDAGRIGKAKDTINGVLVGLLLLFGGYLLLAQISSGLVTLGGLELQRIDPIASDFKYCRDLNNQYDPESGCGSGAIIPIGPLPEGAPAIKCIDTGCLFEDKCMLVDGSAPCPEAVSPLDPTPNCRCVAPVDCSKWNNFNCSNYLPDFVACQSNTCLGQYDQAGIIDDICRTREVGGQMQCIYMEGTGCDINAECYVDGNNDGESEFCCADISGGQDTCRRIGEVTCGDD